jgi:hypothetical protein
MPTLAPLAVTRNRSRHQPTQELIDALREKGWCLASIIETAARLQHPETGDHLIIRVDPSIPERIVSVSVNGSRKEIRRALEFVRGA